ncbi:MAG: hypothetical protein IIY70_02250, partial [Oscillospiraceae bacterium]|nr:hypothetical protein [Oscillospiraceae bacterium]
MSLLLALSRQDVWEAFYQYKSALVCPKDELVALRTYIDRCAYLPVADRIRQGKAFPLPRRVVISKMHSEKK